MKLLYVPALSIILICSVSSYSQLRNPSIRTIDFANFTYPYTVGLLLPPDKQRNFRLRGGSLPETKSAVGMSLGHVFYEDVTRDGSEEAIVYLDVYTNGSARPGCIYIYRMSNGRPQLLWAFDTGSRHYGGLRRVYADRGELVVELYGRAKVIGRALFANDGTLAQTPYPYAVTRTRYRWRVNRFSRVGKPEEFADPHPEKYGIPLFALKS